MKTLTPALLGKSNHYATLTRDKTSPSWPHCERHEHVWSNDSQKTSDTQYVPSFCIKRSLYEGRSGYQILELPELYPSMHEDRSELLSGLALESLITLGNPLCKAYIDRRLIP